MTSFMGVASIAGMAGKGASLPIMANDPDPNTGLWIALGILGIGVGAATILIGSKPGISGAPPSGLNCAKTGLSCASVACCLGQSACVGGTCVGPNTSGTPPCAHVGYSCQNTMCCGEQANVVCASNICVVTQNLTCSNCNPPNICNAGTCSQPTIPCANCTGVIDYCDQSTGICAHPCDPPCGFAGDCDMSNCGNPPIDGCGTCSGTATNWNLSGIVMALYSNVSGPVAAGDVVDVNISFNYTGPGGNIYVGYNAWLNSAIGPVCSLILSDYTPIWIEPSEYGGYLSYYTSGMTWPQMNCLFCDGCTGVVNDLVYTQPFVITPDKQYWTGATVQGLFCC